MDKTIMNSHEITQICLLAGKIILQNGGETYRVEDTMDGLRQHTASKTRTAS